MNYLRCLVLGFGGYFFGYSLGVISPVAKPYFYHVLEIKQDKKTFDHVIGNANLFYSLGGMISVLFLGTIIKYLGRIRTLIIAEALAVVTSLLFLIPNLYLFYALRALSGVVSVMSIVSSTIYLTELMPSNISGIGGLICYISLTTFLLLSFFISYIFTSDQAIIDNYRVIFGWIAVIGVARFTLLIALFFEVKSPLEILAQKYPEEEEE